MTRVLPHTARVGERIRALRQERRWTQARLAKLLGISQNYLSELERGQGSFTAEHLLTVLKVFNVPIDYFSSPKTAPADQIQSALARFGAPHLIESPETLPSQRIGDVADAIREALASAESSRQITAIAPAIVENIDTINFRTLHARCKDLGLELRLGWALENTLEALRRQAPPVGAVESRRKYRRAETLLKSILSLVWPRRGQAEVRGALRVETDVLDRDISSDKSLAEAWEGSSEISRRWGITTRLKVEDFSEALRAARETRR